MYTSLLAFRTMKAEGWRMSDPSTAQKISKFVHRLRTRRQVLVNQLNLREMQDSRQFLQGELSAIDAILQEMIEEFDLSSALSTAEDITEEAWLHALARNPAFGFLADPSEDLYTIDDGKPIPYEDET